jgi:hypothetical protein
LGSAAKNPSTAFSHEALVGEVEGDAGMMGKQGDHLRGVCGLHNCRG